MSRLVRLRSLAFPLVALVAGLSSCECQNGPEDSDPDSASADAAHTVVVITIDSLSPRILMGETWDWDVAPTIHSVFDDSVLLPRVLTPAGTTRPALGSLITALYPQQHGARTNAAELRDGNSFVRQFEQAGYTTFGFSSNQCPLIQDGDVDEYYCTWNDSLEGDHTLTDRDRILVDELNTRLLAVPDDDPIFIWLHLNNVHHPFMADQELVESFYGGVYSGLFRPWDDDMVAEVTLGDREITQDEQDYLEATYAAQLAETDAQIGSLIDTLDGLGRYDDAIVVLGADHGEELGDHGDIDYYWHGCSPYNSVMQVVYSVRAPGRVAGGQVLDSWVSSIDLGPTIVELAEAFEWSGERAGSSIVDYLTGGAAPDVPIFAGRGSNTAMMIHQDHKYVLSDVESFTACEPYSGTGMGYPGELEELYDLSVDQAEVINLADSDTERAESMHTALCEWMFEVGWVPAEQAGDCTLYIECGQWLCEVGSEWCDQ